MGNVTNLTRSGLGDWLVQRVSAVILAVYVLLLVYLSATPAHLTFAAWQQIFAHPWMKFFSLLALLSLLGHVWVGIWTIFTDYIKCPCIRLPLQILVILALIVMLAWGVTILWSV